MTPTYMSPSTLSDFWPSKLFMRCAIRYSVKNCKVLLVKILLWFWSLGAAGVLCRPQGDLLLLWATNRTPFSFPLYLINISTVRVQLWKTIKKGCWRTWTLIKVNMSHAMWGTGSHIVFWFFPDNLLEFSFGKTQRHFSLFPVKRNQMDFVPKLVCLLLLPASILHRETKSYFVKSLLFIFLSNAFRQYWNQRREWVFSIKIEITSRYFLSGE